MILNKRKTPEAISFQKWEDVVFRAIVETARELMSYGGPYTKEPYDQLDAWCQKEDPEVMAGPVYDRIVRDYNFAQALLGNYNTSAKTLERRWLNGEFWFSNFKGDYDNEMLWTNEHGFIIRPGQRMRSRDFIFEVGYRKQSEKSMPLGVYNGMWLERNHETGEVAWETKHRTDC